VLRLRRRLPPRPRQAVDCIAAALLAAAIYLVPWYTLAALAGGGDLVLVVLVAWLIAVAAYLWVVAARRALVPPGWTLGVVVGAVVLGEGVGLVALFAAAAADSCGHSGIASGVKLFGAAVIVVVPGAWALLRRRFAALWVFPVAAAVAAGWVVAVSHLLPNASGGCFE
jgi:hypothetical protein